MMSVSRTLLFDSASLFFSLHYNLVLLFVLNRLWTPKPVSDCHSKEKKKRNKENKQHQLNFSFKEEENGLLY